MTNLLETVVKLRSLLDKNGPYSICKTNGDMLELPDQMTLGKLFLDIDDAIDKLEEKRGVDYE